MSVHQCHGLCNKLQKWMTKNMPHINCSHHSGSQLISQPYSKTSFEGLLRKYPQISTPKDMKSNESKGIKRSFESRVQKYSDQVGGKLMKRASIQSHIGSVVKQYIQNSTQQSKQIIAPNKPQTLSLIQQQKPMIKKIKLNQCFSNKFNSFSKESLSNLHTNKCNDQNNSMLSNQYQEPFWKQSSKLLQDDSRKLFKMNVGKKINFIKGDNTQNVQMALMNIKDQEQRKQEKEGQRKQSNEEQFKDKDSDSDKNEGRQEQMRQQQDGFVLCHSSNDNKITFNSSAIDEQFKNNNDELMIFGFDGQHILEQKNDFIPKEQFQLQSFNNTILLNSQQVESQPDNSQKKETVHQIQEVGELQNQMSEQKAIDIFEKQELFDEKENIDEQKHFEEVDEHNDEFSEQNKVDNHKQVSNEVENSQNKMTTTIKQESANPPVDQPMNKLTLNIEQQLLLTMPIKSQKPQNESSLQSKPQIIENTQPKSFHKPKPSTKPIKLKQNILTRSKQQHLNLFNKLSMRLVRKKYGHELSNSQLADKILQNQSHNVKLKAFLSNEYDQERKTVFDFNQLTQQQMRHILLKYFDQDWAKFKNLQ